MRTQPSHSGAPVSIAARSMFGHTNFAKDAVVAGREPQGVPDRELVESWRRCVSRFGDPSGLRSIPTVPESWLDDAPLDLLRRPLDELKVTLKGAGAAMLLADARGLVLDRWFEDSSAGAHLDSVGSGRGSDLREGSVGTNAVSLALATGRLVQVSGSEHYNDFFSHSACVAEPIPDPVSGDLLAVITLTAPVNPRIDLMRGWLATACMHLVGHVARRLSRPSTLQAEDIEKWALRQALAETDGDIARTCEILGISRATVYRRIRRYRISSTG